MPAPEPDDDATDKKQEEMVVRGTNEDIEEAEEHLKEELARLSGEEDTTAIKEANDTFAATFVELGAERSAQLPTFQPNQDRSTNLATLVPAEQGISDGGARQRVPVDPAAVVMAARVLMMYLAAAHTQHFFASEKYENPDSAVFFSTRGRASEGRKTLIQPPERRPPPEIAKAIWSTAGRWGHVRGCPPGQHASEGVLDIWRRHISNLGFPDPREVEAGWRAAGQPLTCRR